MARTKQQVMNPLVFLLASILFAEAQNCSYEESFSMGTVLVNSTQCEHWNNFRECAASGSFSAVRFTSSDDPTLVFECTVPEIANEICNNIGASYTGGDSSTFECDGFFWSAGLCGGVGVEIYPSSNLLFCNGCNKAAAIRPCINNMNWGGLFTTCNAPSQTISFQCLSGHTGTVDCGNCNALEGREGQSGCDVPFIEECVEGMASQCVNDEWTPKCAALVEDVCIKPYECSDPAPSCDSEPFIPNAEPVFNCAGTESGEYCTTLSDVQCQANFTNLWSSDPFCYAGRWVSVPQCSRSGWGSGHLWFLSLDGLLFSYHRTGVIRMWESEPNDMELQIRTLRPAGISCDATLIGQLAFRAGATTITVVGSEDAFDVRINGVQQAVTPGVSSTLYLNNGPDELLVELKESSMSIVSKRGAILNIVYYVFSGMSWLVVPHSLNPANFGGNTRGLLGEYDDDPLNDFTTRDGVVLPVISVGGSNNEQREFGDSWVVDASESLFGPEEDAIALADAQYSGAPHDEEGGIPCPTDFSNYSIPECDALDAQLVDACYFDVVLGGPQFLDDIQYLPACGNNSDQYCSYHGECVDDACQCDNGWTGEDCEIRVCPTECIASAGSTGGCRADGICDCLVGFTGRFCEDTVSCEDVGDCNAASGNGICVDTNTCECTSLAYDLPDCTAPSVPTFTFPPSPEPTPMPTGAPTPIVTNAPTPIPTADPTTAPTSEPTAQPTAQPTADPTAVPTPDPTASPTSEPTSQPTAAPTADPTSVPTSEPTAQPTAQPTAEPTAAPTSEPTAQPTADPTADPTAAPTLEPTAQPSAPPTAEPTERPVPGNTAISVCATNERDGFCIAEDDTSGSTAAVVCCREDRNLPPSPGAASMEIECVSEHSMAVDSNRNNRHSRLQGAHSKCFPTDVSYANADEFCEDLETSTQPQNLMLCEGDEKDIECPDDLKIEILHANYGRTASDVCEHIQVSDTSCTDDTHTERLRQECNGKSKCSVRASNSYWGDTCYGTYKYLDVDFTCAGVDDWRLCTLGELADDGACCGEGGNTLLGSDDSECDITTMVWASDLCVPLPSVIDSNECECDVEISQLREEVYADIWESDFLHERIAEEVQKRLAEAA